MSAFGLTVGGGGTLGALKRLQLQAACPHAASGRNPKTPGHPTRPKTWELDVITFVITLAA